MQFYATTPRWLSLSRVDFTQTTKAGVNALIWACEKWDNGHPHDIEIVKVLLAKSNINHEDKSNRTALSVALKNGQDQIVDLLIKEETLDVYDAMVRNVQYGPNQATQLLQQRLKRQLLLGKEAKSTAYRLSKLSQLYHQQSGKQNSATWKELQNLMQNIVGQPGGLQEQPGDQLTSLHICLGFHFVNETDEMIAKIKQFFKIAHLIQPLRRGLDHYHLEINTNAATGAMEVVIPNFTATDLKKLIEANPVLLPRERQDFCTIS